MKATGKKESVKRTAKKPSAVNPGMRVCVAHTIAAFVDYRVGVHTLEWSREAFKVARHAVRYELKRASGFFKGREWDAYKGKVADGLVSAKVCESRPSALKLISNQMIALGLAGNGTNGVRRKGRKEKTESGEAINATNRATIQNAAALKQIAHEQQTFAGESDFLESLGRIAACLTA